MFFTSIQLFLFDLFSRERSLTLCSPHDNLLMFFSIPVCVFDICLPHGWRGLEAGDQVLFIFVSLASGTWRFHGWIWVKSWTMSYFLWPYETLNFFYIYNIQSNFLVIDPFLLLGTCRVIVFFFVLKLPLRSSSKTLFVLIDCSLENMDPFTLSATCSISWNQTTSSFRHMSLRLQNLLVVFQSVRII